MNDKIIIINNGVDTVYVREDLAIKNTGVGLYREQRFCGLDWQVIGEDAETVTLLSKECLSKDLIKKIFESNEYDSDYDVRFNNDYSEWRWEKSTIRKRLNDKFLKMLDKSKLVPMTTTVWLDGESSTTKDYVRLLTLEEISKLPKSIKADKCGYWYWSLSPYLVNANGYAYVFLVNAPGNMGNDYVNNSGAVAPVIKLKRSVLKTDKLIKTKHKNKLTER